MLSSILEIPCFTENMTVLVGTVSLKSSVKEPQREALKALAADILAGE